MSTLRIKQSQFVLLLAELIMEAHNAGFDLTFGEAYRSDEQAAINALGHSGRQEAAAVLRSKPLLFNLAAAIGNNTKDQNGILLTLHNQRLAVDFNIFIAKTGELATAEQIRPLGEIWERMGGTWGGRFKDPSHFSMEHEGRK